MTLVIFLTFILFLTSGLLLPYIPTVLASALVLFLGIELFLEAVWESAKTLAWLEWGISVGTLLACTFLGFAEGFGVGIGAATVVYLAYGVIDSVSIFPSTCLECEMMLTLFPSLPESCNGKNGTKDTGSTAESRYILFISPLSTILPPCRTLPPI